MPIPLFDTRTALEPLREELHQALLRAADSGSYILGPEVEAFEREFAAYCRARHAVGVPNGTDAIQLALRALGVGPGDDVVVPSFTFYASAEAIPPTGARPAWHLYVARHERADEVAKVTEAVSAALGVPVPS